MTHHSVIIIGAGMAGVKTAVDLNEGGITDTLILESRDRLGGRLVSVDSSLNPNVKYDLGALWFHDALNNPLLQKAKQLGNIEFFFDDGKQEFLCEDETIPVWKFEAVMTEIMTYCGLSYGEDPSKKDISVHELCQEYLENYGELLTPDERKYAFQVVRMWCELWFGILWDDASAKYAAGVVHYGRNAFVKSGYVAVFNNELIELPDSYKEKNIKLNSQVVNIDYLNPNLVTVTTKNKETYTADYVVVTIPLSLLSLQDPQDECYLSWAPTLPSKFTDLWPHGAYGSLGKVVFEFPKCFWSEDTHRFNVLATEGEVDIKAKPWQHPTILINYYALCKTPSLVAVMQEPVLKQVENMTQDEIWTLFEPVISKIATGKVVKPFKIHTTSWNKDQWARGSYSATRVGSIDPSIITETLAEGLNERVRFAGAETIDGSANGCAHGAWYSGLREAAHILEHAKVDDKL